MPDQAAHSDAPSPCVPPLDIVTAYEKPLAQGNSVYRQYTLFFKETPKGYARKLAKLHRRTHWSPGDDEKLLLAEKHFALTDTHLHAIHGRKEGYEHVALPIAEIEAIEFRPPPRAEFLHMTLITPPRGTVVITRYGDSDDLHTMDMSDLLMELLGLLVRNAHGYPLEFTDEEYLIATRAEVVRYAITEILQDTATVTIQRGLSEKFSLSSYAPRELVIRIRYLIAVLSPKQASRALWRSLGTAAGIIFLVSFVCTMEKVRGMGFVFLGIAVLLLIMSLLAAFVSLQRKRDATADPDELCQRYLDAAERARDQARNRDELPQFPGDQELADPNR
jgi:Na+-transporting methylmalonyl-CoA/oxaloacetate decarboxylase gamma subunit